MMMFVYLFILCVCGTATKNEYFRAVFKTRKVCQRGIGLTKFLENEVKFYPMTVYYVASDDKDYISFEDVMGNEIEQIDITSYEFKQIVDVMDQHGFRQYK